jgi:hypothetical protein
VFFILLGGLIGEYLLRRRAWRWIRCFGALSAGMFALDVATYPATPHIERPGVRYRGEWLSSFLWIRDHTPKDALFALDPEYLLTAGQPRYFLNWPISGRSRARRKRIGLTFPGIDCRTFESATA